MSWSAQRSFINFVNTDIYNMSVTWASVVNEWAGTKLKPIYPPKKYFNYLSS